MKTRQIYKNIFLIVYFVAFILLFLLRSFSEDENTKQLYLMILIALGVVFFLLVILVTIYMNKEFKRVTQKVDYYINNKLYKEGIDYLENKIQSYFLTGLVVSQRINLISLLLLDNQKNEARYLLFDCDHKGLEINVYYYYILFSLYDGEIETAKKYYARFIRFDNPLYDEQKKNCKLLIEAVENRYFTYDLYDLSEYPIVKELCEKYDSIY